MGLHADVAQPLCHSMLRPGGGEVDPPPGAAGVVRACEHEPVDCPPAVVVRERHPPELERRPADRPAGHEPEVDPQAPATTAAAADAPAKATAATSR
jgi:hypothetical protein